jgi:hypothetical protein
LETPFHLALPPLGPPSLPESYGSGILGLIRLRLRLYLLADGNLKRFVHEYIYVAACESAFAWKESET